MLTNLFFTFANTNAYTSSYIFEVFVHLCMLTEEKTKTTLKRKKKNIKSTLLSRIIGKKATDTERKGKNETKQHRDMKRIFVNDKHMYQ